jgi:hypothetical protein
MSENELTQNVALLLQHSTKIIKDYDALYREKGLKYNIFKIARITEKEVIMCRVIADLLNPKGSHYKGDIYLKLFWNIVSSKMENRLILNAANAKVITEYSTDANRRIDIVIDDGNIFIPIEAKIFAGEQEDQVKDYAKYSRAKNKGKNIPVLFLTLYGRESETAEENEYLSISFHEDIISWLEQCLKLSETEKTPPIREVIKQLLDAINLLLGTTEDKEMNKIIVNLIMQSEATMRAAMEIGNVLNVIDDAKWELFKGIIFKNVKNQFPDANIQEDVGGWFDISVPIKNGSYILRVNYNWQSIIVEANGKNMSASIEKAINKKMTALTGISDDEIDEVWRAENTVRYPGMENVDEAMYPYLLYKKYEQAPEEVANHIITMVNELEKA